MAQQVKFRAQVKGQFMNMFHRLFSAALLTATIMPRAALAETPTPPAMYTTLAARRPLITLPAYSPEEKQRVANQAQIILRDVYVNRERKMAAYGPQNDPLAGVADVVAQARVMSEETLHHRLELLFTSQHDLHLSYRYPQPFACYRSLLPFSLQQARDPTGRVVVAVKALAKDTAIFTVSPEARQVEVGDVLISYDGVDPLVAAASIANISGGANEFGSVRRAIENLTYRSQRAHRLPENDLVRLTFRSRVGQDYNLELPWISKADLNCLAPTEPGHPGLARQVAKGKTDGVDEYQVEFEQLYKPHERINEDKSLTDTAEPILHFDTLQNEYGTFGYLRLDSFVPESLPAGDVVLLVRHLLQNELAGTDGLILDLRDNGGGDINFAESLVQLFTSSNIEPQGFRLLSSAVNRDLFQRIPSWSDGYRNALGVAQTIGAHFTTTLPLTEYASTNSTGQAYFKPMAVLTNSSCYSSCDMMSASLQDHGVATIFGEDGRTGGGGANNVQLYYFLASLHGDPNGPFAALPGKQGMGVAWRQTVRVGKSAGQLLEEDGVRADKLATPSIADFFTSDSVQMRTIAADLNLQTRTRQSWFKFVVDGRQDFAADVPLAFHLNVSDTEAVETRINRASMGYHAVSAPATTTGSGVEVKIPGSPLAGSLGTVELIGYAGGERVWRAMQSYRVIPGSTALADGARLAFDFSTPDVNPMTVFTTATEVSQGWSVQSGKLKVGLGDQYPDNLQSEAALFLDLSGRSQPLTVSFDVEGSTEQDYDYFSVAAFTGGTLHDLLKPVSGVIPSSHMSYDLSPYLGEQVEIRFTFTSDGGVTDRGVSISHLIIE